MDEMMNSVSVQIQRAISDAKSTQVLPQIQNVVMAGLGHGIRKGWDVPSQRPELISEVQRNLNLSNEKSNLRNEQDENQLNNDYPDLNVHDNLPKSSKLQVPKITEFAQMKSHMLIPWYKQSKKIKIRTFINYLQTYISSAHDLSFIFLVLLRKPVDSQRNPYKYLKI